MSEDPLREPLAVLGNFIREQRHQAQLTLRELAARANVSNPYLSQVERGLHEPSLRVLSSIAGALDVSASSLLSILGMGSGDDDRPATESAIRSDPHLSRDQKESLLAVYRSYLRDTDSRAEDSSDGLADPGSTATTGTDAADAGFSGGRVENDRSGP